MNNIEELKRMAEAATPGPWEVRAGVLRKIGEQPQIATIYRPYNSQFIAAANPAAVLDLIAEVEYLRGKNREHFDACIGCDEELKRVTKQRDELMAALKSYRAARAMPSYGDYASIQWESQQGPTNPQWDGGDCKKHGRWYGHCHCCANDWDKLKKQADQDAVHARDNALRKADALAIEAISKAEG